MRWVPSPSHALGSGRPAFSSAGSGSRSAFARSPPYPCRCEGLLPLNATGEQQCTAAYQRPNSSVTPTSEVHEVLDQLP